MPKIKTDTVTLTKTPKTKEPKPGKITLSITRPGGLSSKMVIGKATPEQIASAERLDEYLVAGDKNTVME